MAAPGQFLLVPLQILVLDEVDPVPYKLLICSTIKTPSTNRVQHAVLDFIKHSVDTEIIISVSWCPHVCYIELPPRPSFSSLGFLLLCMRAQTEEFCGAGLRLTVSASVVNLARVRFEFLLRSCIPTFRDWTFKLSMPCFVAKETCSLRHVLLSLQGFSTCQLLILLRLRP